MIKYTQSLPFFINIDIIRMQLKSSLLLLDILLELGNKRSDENDYFK